jgi:molecular chaperone GrpE
MNMVLTQLKTTLAAHGLKEINPPPGEKFDPHQHEAISTQSHSEIADGAIAQVFRVGYSLNERILRPAAVVVSSGAGKAPSSG